MHIQRLRVLNDAFLFEQHREALYCDEGNIAQRRGDKGNVPISEQMQKRSIEANNDCASDEKYAFYLTRTVHPAVKH